MSSDRELAEAVNTVESGEIIGDYRLERLLGAGATSRVFLGVHTRLGRHAAVKVLSPQLVDEPAIIERLLREARVVNDIRHPNIVDISDFIDTPNPRRVALIMEYIEGPSLKALRNSRIEFGQAIGITLQLVAAVQAAHNAGVIHRDLKPDNLLLLLDPRRAPGAIPGLKVVDFGLAKVVHPGKNAATGVMLGTPAYMAPEQIAGRPAPSPATDVYAIAEVLYELLSGERLFPPATISETIRAKLRGPLPPMTLPELPGRARLLELIAACLAIAPKERPGLDEVRSLLIGVCPEHVLKIGSGTWGVSESDHELSTLGDIDDEVADERTDVTTQPGSSDPNDLEVTHGLAPDNQGAPPISNARTAATPAPRPPIGPAVTDVDPPPPDAVPTRVAISDSAARALASPVSLAEPREPEVHPSTAFASEVEAPTHVPDAPTEARTFAEPDPTPPGPTPAPLPLVAPASKSRAAWWIGIAAVFFAGAVGVAVKRSGAKATTNETPAAVPAVQAASQVLIPLSSDPTGAMVRDEQGIVLGRTPLEVPVRTNGSREVTVSAIDHVTKRVIVSSTDAAIEVKLEARDVPSPKRRTKKSDDRTAERGDDEAFPSW